jgi:two-component system LytT family response regulator
VWLPVTTRNGIVLLSPSEITHAVLDDELVTIHTTKAEYLTDFTLQDLETRLAGVAERVHRKALLNLAHVACLEPCETGGFVARTSNGKLVQVSRQAARDLRRRLGLRGGDE